MKAEGGQYFVTFRLADSLPVEILRQLEEIPEKQRSKKVEEHLDAAHGECLLGEAAVADLVKQVMLKFKGERYQLHAWVIMPNHVHMLVEPVAGKSLSEILQGIKSVSSHAVNRLLGRDGDFWQSESYDHLIRDDADRARCIEYIAQNPVRAGLVKSAGEFQFSSLHELQKNAGGSPAPQKQVAGDKGGVSELPKPVAVAAKVAPVLPLDARSAEIAGMEWPQLKESVAACTACALHKDRNKTVFGVGDEKADWLFVGEGPGADEDAQGEPFVGQAGKLLDNMLAAIELKRGDNVYIANVVKCRPPGNRNPEPPKWRSASPTCSARSN